MSQDKQNRNHPLVSIMGGMAVISLLTWGGCETFKGRNDKEETYYNPKGNVEQEYEEVNSND